KAPFVGPIVDIGCGTGTLLRILGGIVSSTPLVGVERAPNLVAIGRELSRGQANIQIMEGSSDTLEPLHAPFRTLISVCGLEFLGQPAITIEDEYAIADGVVPIRAQAWANQYGAALDHWRKIAHNGARLILVGRLATVTSIAAFIR